MGREVDTRKAIRVLWDNGYYQISQNGSHIKFINDANDHITIRQHIMNKRMWLGIVKEHNLVIR